MPQYDFVCLDCKHGFTRILPPIPLEKLRIVCTKCGSLRVERIMMALTYGSALRKQTA